MITDFLVSCTSSLFVQTSIGAIIFYHVATWIFKPKLRDSYFKIDESKFYELQYVGKHSSKIPLDDIPTTIAEMRSVYQSNITRRLSERKKQLRALQRLISENEEAIIA